MLYESDERLKCVAYARVSTDDKGQTCSTQLDAIRNWADKNGYQVVEEFQEEMSGTIDNRPEIQRCLGYCKVNNIPVLVVYDSSRLTRSDNLKKYKQMFSPTIIRYVGSDFDPNSLAGQITDSITSIMDKRENDIRREKTTLRLAELKREGKHTGRPSAFEIVSDEKHPDGKIIIGDQISRDGKYKRKTKLLTKEELLGYADKGYTLSTLARILDISKSTIFLKVKKAQLFDEYMSRLQLHYQK